MRRIFAVIFLWGIMVQLAVGRVAAANLDQTTIRLERMAAGMSPLPMLVMVKTNTAALENGVKIQVGSAWTVDGDQNNLTVSTAGLPSGVTVWPGIGKANGVAGQTVSFPSGDLTAGVSYGFYITGGIGVNPAEGDGSNYKWEVMTLSGGNPSDSTEVKVPVSVADTVTITGRVGAKASDFQLGITADKTGDLSVGDEVTYQINYGTYLQSAVKPLVITAEWSRGTVSGSPIPSVDIADYVVGSGTTAWGGVEPVIDPVNRKITWTISSFPANTVNQMVEFKLTVNDSYSGDSDVMFTTTAGLTGANVVTITSAIDNVYHPQQLTSTATPTPTAAGNPTTTSTTTVSPTVTPTPTAILKIEKIEVVTLSNNGTSISLNLNFVPETIEFFYGTSLLALNSSVISINGLKQDLLNINDLKPNTDYFFKVIATDTSGNKVKSDVYTFRTAASSDMPEIDPNSIIISAADNILLDSRVENSGVNAVVVISDQNYALRVNLVKSEIVKSIKVMIENSQVLGITTAYGAEPNSTEENLVEVGNGGFVAHLVAPKVEGFYNIVVRIEDTNGNISEKKIGEIRVTPPLTVVDENGQPVEKAKVVFYRLNQKLKTYELIGREMFGIQNPSYTETNGQVVVNFPKGSYRIEVSAIGFATREVNFNLGLGEDEKMPRVVLKKTAMGLPILASYYGAVSSDVFSFSKDFLYNLTTSSRFFKLTSLMVIFTGVIMWWLFVCYHWGIYWWLLPKKIAAKMINSSVKQQKGFLSGMVIDPAVNRPIRDVKVYLLDDRFNKVLSKAITDSLGEFRLTIKPAKGYRLAAVKDGFEPTPILDFTTEGINAGKVKLMMNNVLSEREKIENVLKYTFGRTGSWLVSVWLLGLVGLELIFWYNFNLDLVWPWLLMMTSSLILWLIMVFRENEVEKS